VTGTPARVSAIVVAYRSGDALSRCLESVLAARGVLETIVVDNGDGGPEIEAARGLARVQVVEPDTNLGYGGGCNAGAAEARGDVLVFLNADTELDPVAAESLAAALADATIGVAMPRLRLLDDSERLNSGGNVVHLTGLAWPGGYGEPAESVAERRDIPYASGAALALRAETFRELGGFAEELFLYQEDLELSWRARLAGLRVVVEPTADVRHAYRYEPLDAEKHYWLERNRLVFVLTAYSGRLLVLLAPVLAATEIALALLARREGWWPEKRRGWAWILGHGGVIRRLRRRTQSLRRIPDREAARFLTDQLDPAMRELPPAAARLQPLVRGYWALARRAL
jgi:GT2 family glycosyltransferase